MVRKRIKRGLRVSRYIIYKETLVDVKEHIWSFIGAFVGIGLIALFQSQLLTKFENIFLIGSFGAWCRPCRSARRSRPTTASRFPSTLP